MIRLVKMTFDPDRTDEFEELFQQVKDKIRNFPGCTHVELLRDFNQGNIYFTRSIWVNEEALQHYRHSELFADTWNRTKVLFSGKPEAWSTEVVAVGNL